jgi:hypothetical protein
MPDAPPSPTVPTPPLARADLIEAAARAADSTARGVPAPPDLRALAGRRFMMKIPFGCGGTVQAGSAFEWRYDADNQNLRASITPQAFTASALVGDLARGQAIEAAEGFWISRPWLRVGDCPSASSPPMPGTGEGAQVSVPESPSVASPDPVSSQPSARETLGIVELFEPGSRRAARRNGRPYELVARIGPGEIDLASGLRLVLEGRLASTANEAPIACRSGGFERPPTCLIAAEFERVAVTDGSGQRVLAEWEE